jgi:hypothetical protein
MTAPVVLASAPAPHPNPAPLIEGEQREDGAGATSPAAPLLRQASLKLPERQTQTQAVANKSAQAISVTSKPTGPQAVAALKKKAGDKVIVGSAKPVTKLASRTKIDPLAPLPAGASVLKLVKDSGSAR